MSSSLSTPKIQFVCALNMSVQCVPFFLAQEEKVFLCTYIYHTLRTLFGPLDSMDQSSELGRAIKNQATICVQPHY